VAGRSPPGKLGHTIASRVRQDGEAISSGKGEATTYIAVKSGYFAGLGFKDQDKDGTDDGKKLALVPRSYKDGNSTVLEMRYRLIEAGETSGPEMEAGDVDTDSGIAPPLIRVQRGATIGKLAGRIENRITKFGEAIVTAKGPKQTSQVVGAVMRAEKYLNKGGNATAALAFVPEMVSDSAESTDNTSMQFRVLRV